MNNLKDLIAQNREERASLYAAEQKIHNDIEARIKAAQKKLEEELRPQLEAEAADEIKQIRSKRDYLYQEGISLRDQFAETARDDREGDLYVGYETADTSYWARRGDKYRMSFWQVCLIRKESDLYELADRKWGDPRLRVGDLYLRRVNAKGKLLKSFMPYKDGRNFTVKVSKLPEQKEFYRDTNKSAAETLTELLSEVVA